VVGYRQFMAQSPQFVSCGYQLHSLNYTPG